MNELVYLRNEEAMTDSLMVAEIFNKRHTDVLRDIKSLDCSEEFTKRNFALSRYKAKLANKMAGVDKRDQATVMQLNNLSLMENIILHVIDTGILMGKHYKDIYKDCKARLETVSELAYLRGA